MPRIIAHIDMDAFFAAVEERDRPRLKGKPIVVGSDPEDGRGRGVVSTANYAARKYGIHSAMPITQAWQCSENTKKNGLPAAIFISPNGSKYSRVSNSIQKIFERHVPLVEQVSIDEAFLDLSFTKTYNKAKKILEKIRKEIKVKEKLSCSIGVGPNKLVAKIASDFKKPNGLTVVNEREAEKFLEPLSIRKIPGIGPKTEILLKKYMVENVRDLKKFSIEELKKILGKWGSDLYFKARGLDTASVKNDEEIKSIGEQETFREDSLDSGFILKRLSALSAQVFSRLKKAGFQSYRTVVVTVRLSNFETKNRSHTLSEPSASKDVLEFEALKLITLFLDKRENPKKMKIRLIGVRVEKLI